MPDHQEPPFAATQFADGATLAYRGKAGFRNVTCTRRSDLPDVCYGWHCAHCHEPCSMQGHVCRGESS